LAGAKRWSLLATVLRTEVSHGLLGLIVDPVWKSGARNRSWLDGAAKPKADMAVPAVRPQECSQAEWFA
jgi:hypothetical protein